MKPDTFRNLAFLPVILCFSGCVSDTSSNYLPGNSQVEVHAHRGGAAQEPENSLKAFHTSVTKVGVDAIELDIHSTSDQVLVIHHDPTLNPALCTGPGGKPLSGEVSIPATTFADLETYDCGPRVGLPPGTHLPTLDDVFSLVESLHPIKGTAFWGVTGAPCRPNRYLGCQNRMKQMLAWRDIR